MKLHKKNIQETGSCFMRELELSYKKYYNLIYNYGLKFMDDPELIEDFIQDIFVKLCKRGNLQDIHDLKVYLLRAMRNMVYDHFATLHSIISIDDLNFSLPDAEENFHPYFFSKDDEEVNQSRLLLKAINDLSSRQKQILYLFYIQELSHKEIARILNITPQASMNAVSIAIRKLKEKIGKPLLPLGKAKNDSP